MKYQTCGTSESSKVAQTRSAITHMATSSNGNPQLSPHRGTFPTVLHSARANRPHSSLNKLTRGTTVYGTFKTSASMLEQADTASLDDRPVTLVGVLTATIKSAS